MNIEQTDVVPTRPHRTLNRSIFRGVVVFVTCLLALGTYAAINFPDQANVPEVPENSQKQALASVPSVQVLKPRRSDLARAVRLPATLSPLSQVTLYPKVSGYLKSVHVDKGDVVADGQLLAVIDVPELGERYQQAQSAFTIKKLTFERMQNVWNSNPDVIAKQDVDVAEAAYLGAKHAVAQLDTELQYTKVHAPFAGMITARFVDAGALVQAATSSATQVIPLFTLMDISTLRVYANVSQEDVLLVRTGARASLKVDQLPDEEFRGRVTRFTGALDPSTRTMLVEVQIPNKERQLHPGMFVTLTLYLEEHKDALAIPPAALVTAGPGPSVFVVDQGKAKQVPITTGLDDGAWIEVVSGLSGEEEVILVGKSGLTDGQVVQAAPYTLPKGKPARQKM